MPILSSKFNLTIKLGNDAMSTKDDIARALRDLAGKLDRTDSDSGRVRDDNGNTVGSWEID